MIITVIREIVAHVLITYICTPKNQILVLNIYYLPGPIYTILWSILHDLGPNYTT